jgi:hypothetical protein
MNNLESFYILQNLYLRGRLDGVSSFVFFSGRMRRKNREHLLNFMHAFKLFFGLIVNYLKVKMV